jgi:hypothetical protein
MCFLSAEADPEPAPGSFGFARRLSFDGPLKGSFGVRTSSDAASTIACNLLGDELDEITPEQIGDSIGELANMLCGAVLCRIELKRAFTLGKPVEDEESTPGPNGNPHHVVRQFNVDGGCLQTWLEINGAA